MRVSSVALVLATVAIAQVAAGPVRHNHAHFHAKRDAELKVEEAVEERDLADVDWSKVSYTYSAGQEWGAPTPAAATPASTAAPVAAAVPAAVTSAASAVKAAVSSVASSAATVATEILSAADEAALKAMGALVGQNAVANNGEAWIGPDGDFVEEIINASGEDIIFVCWGNMGSWINAQAPLITHSIGAGQKITVSFAAGAIGAFAAVYSDTQLVDGQVSSTWREHNFGPWATVDVSKEVYMNGREISTTTPVGCETNFEKCVFECAAEGVLSCMTDYKLVNCAGGSQVGAQFGQFDGADSGGCSVGSSGSLTTTFY